PARSRPRKHGQRRELGGRQAREVGVDGDQPEEPDAAADRLLPLPAVRTAPRLRARRRRQLSMSQDVGKKSAAASKPPDAGGETTLARLRRMRELALQGGGKERVEAQHKKGKLTAREIGRAHV